jgi:PPOX class probable F420-dependent enzyme
MARPMSPDEVQEFLSGGTHTAKLATTMADGSPHVMPVWFIVEDGVIIFNTGRETVKGRNLLRDPRVAMIVDDEAPPFAFVHLRGRAQLSEDPAELLRTATLIGGRYMGADRAEEFGRRNAVPGELVVSIRPDRVIAQTDVSD